MSTHSHPIVTYNAAKRNDSSEAISHTRRTVNEFVNGSDESYLKTVCKPAFRSQFQLIIINHRTEYALGARDRQFKSGHPDFYFPILQAFTYKVHRIDRSRSPAVNVIVND